MPLNIMQQAARMDEAVDEQGAPAWISPDKGVVIDGEFSDAPTIHNEQRGAEELLAPRQAAPAMPATGAADDKTAAEWDIELGEAAKKGTDALQKFWLTIPRAYQTELKAALDRRHKATAADADAKLPV